jgi:prevent-host-death family protein
VEQVLISKFKARCIELIKRVQETGEPLVVTRRGKPLAQVMPIQDSGESAVKLGTKLGDAHIKGNLVQSSSCDDWEMEQ